MNIALVGNPNSGKSSLFNNLTGLNQKIGNFPGVTIDKKTGIFKVSDKLSVTLIDLPGSYSLYPRREDEWVAYRVLMNQEPTLSPEIVIVVADASNLKRNLLFCTQLIDLKIPVVVALTMMDIAKNKGINIDIPGLEIELGVPVIPVNPRKNKGIAELKKAVDQTIKQLYKVPAVDFIPNTVLADSAIKKVQELIPGTSDYKAIHYLINHESLNFDAPLQDAIESTEKEHQFNHTKTQAEEITQRYSKIRNMMRHTVSEPDPVKKSMFTEKLDNILLDKRWSYLILFSVLFLLFQSVFWLAEYPMNWIDSSFSWMTSQVAAILPEGWVSDLLVDGILAGLGGIVIFVPQIVILFGLITLLEDTGYMARMSFLMDRLMRQVGLNGKSIMPMISGFACSIPAIMSARSIENKKERLLTILITPLMSCSARLPIYIIIIALIIPDTKFLGVFNLQGLVMMLLYLSGIVVALIVAWAFKWFIKIKEKSYFILELPVYRAPRWKNIGLTMYQKAKIFVVDAGKVIMVVSIILWFLSNFGPADKMEAVEAKYERLAAQSDADESVISQEKSGELLANSYAGLFGKAIEPVITPLGYDWKIGIALLTSFAAREVFVGTMATIYSVGDESEESPLLKEKMQQATFADGSKVYTLATGASLLVFYVLAMQCMSTLAIVKRETKSWKWPVIQFVYMTLLAYIGSFITYQLLS